MSAKAFIRVICPDGHAFNVSAKRRGKGRVRCAVNGCGGKVSVPSDSHVFVDAEFASATTVYLGLLPDCDGAMRPPNSGRFF